MTGSRRSTDRGHARLRVEGLEERRLLSVVPAGLVPATVVAREIFYNNSGFDDGTPDASPTDSSAIATDKTAYLPDGGATSPVNVTNYSKGINGIIVDLAGAHGPITDVDFRVRMSGQLTAANSTSNAWSSAPTPTVTVFSDTPVAGTDRIELTWADGAITDRYLQVIVEGNDAAGGNNTNTGLEASDFFFFGNKIGDDFTGYPGFFATDATDEIGARGHQGLALSTINAYDFNKDAIVNSTDQIIARHNQGYMPAINILGSGSVHLMHADGSSSAFPAAADTDEARGTALREATIAAVAGDTVLLGPGTFNIDAAGDFLNIPGGVAVRGAGIDISTIETNLNNTDVTGTTSVRLGGSNITLEDLTIHGTRNDNTYQMPLGPDYENVNDIVLRRIKIFAPNTGDGLYDWTPQPSSYFLYDCEFITGYDTLVTLSSNVGDIVYAENCYFEADGTGWSGIPNGLANNIVNKAGSHTYVGCRFKTRNDASGNLQTLAVWNLQGNAVSTLIDCEFDTVASDGNVYDLLRPQGGSGGFVISGGHGSGPNGEITTSGGNVTYAPPTSSAAASVLAVPVDPEGPRLPLTSIHDTKVGPPSAAPPIISNNGQEFLLALNVSEPLTAPTGGDADAGGLRFPAYAEVPGATSDVIAIDQAIETLDLNADLLAPLLAELRRPA